VTGITHGHTKNVRHTNGRCEALQVGLPQCGFQENGQRQTAPLMPSCAPAPAVSLLEDPQAQRHSDAKERPLFDRILYGTIPCPVADMTVRISRKEIRRRRFSSQRTM
jgi:hypothetical protein